MSPSDGTLNEAEPVNPNSIVIAGFAGKALERTSDSHLYEESRRKDTRGGR
jgi:hypothetical protein